MNSFTLFTAFLRAFCHSVFPELTEPEIQLLAGGGSAKSCSYDTYDLNVEVHQTILHADASNIYIYIYIYIYRYTYTYT